MDLHLELRHVSVHVNAILLLSGATRRRGRQVIIKLSIHHLLQVLPAKDADYCPG